MAFKSVRENMIISHEMKCDDDKKDDRDEFLGSQAASSLHVLLCDVLMLLNGTFYRLEDSARAS